MPRASGASGTPRFIGSTLRSRRTGSSAFADNDGGEQARVSYEFEDPRKKTLELRLVIASKQVVIKRCPTTGSAQQSRCATQRKLDCFVASAPRNDGSTHRLFVRRPSPTAVMLRASGASSTPRPIRFIAGVAVYWIVRSSRTTTAESARKVRAMTTMLFLSAARCARELARNSVAL